MMGWRFWVCVWMASLAVSMAHASDDIYPFAHPEQAEQFHRLNSELRCLVCQNQTIGDSNAKLAVDLRQQVYEQIQQGHTDADIKAFLVSRYGEFVLFNPALNERTGLLWVAPFLLLLSGVLLCIRWVHRRSSTGEPL